MASFQMRMLQRWQKMWESGLSDEGKNKIKLMLDSGDLLLFFHYKGEIYGAPEASRVTFARLKDTNDPETDAGWRDEASFTATNLSSAVRGRPTQTIFSEKDIKDIQIIANKEEVGELLANDITSTNQ